MNKCDFCKFESEYLFAVDAHGAMGKGSMYAFLCHLCQTVNDAYWKLSGISMTTELVITMNRRAFNRYRKEFKNGYQAV